MCTYIETDIVDFDNFLMIIKPNTDFRTCFNDIVSYFAFVVKIKYI